MQDRHLVWSCDRLTGACGLTDGAFALHGAHGAYEDPGEKHWSEQHALPPMLAPPGLHGDLCMIDTPPQALVGPPSDPSKHPAQTPQQATLYRDDGGAEPPVAHRTVAEAFHDKEQDDEPSEHRLHTVDIACAPEGHRVLV